MIASAFFLAAAVGASYLALNMATRAFTFLLTILKWIIRCIAAGLFLGLVTNHEAVLDFLAWIYQGFYYSLQ